MAKNEEKMSTEVSVFGQDAQLPADMSSELEGLSGLGYSERAEDSLVPILSILQDTSGETKRQHSKYIEGAKPGDLIIRSLSMVIDPEKTVLPVQPCGFQHMWVEWDGEPGDGTVVNQYPFDERPDDAKEKALGDDDRMTWVMPSGNRLVDTRYHYCQIMVGGSWMPVVIPMSGTNHTVSRGWTAQLKMLKAPGGQKAPSWFRAYVVQTKFNQRGTQSWFNYDLKDAGWISDASVRQDGRALYESLESNVIAPDISSESGSSSDNSESIPI